MPGWIQNVWTWPRITNSHRYAARQECKDRHYCSRCAEMSTKRIAAIKERATPINACPFCRQKFDRAMSAYNSTNPRPGDASVCHRCAGLLVFTDNLAIRAMTNKEWLKLGTKSKRD